MKIQDKVFVAGATGVIGQRLVPMLLAAGFEVHGMTRSAQKAQHLESAGAKAWVLDAFDAEGLLQALLQVRPEIIVHQLTDLPRNLEPARMADAVVRNARIRSLGTASLVRAARLCGCCSMVAQSIAWAYEPGAQPYTEAQPLDRTATGSRAITVSGVAALESAVLTSPGLRGTVLRYGNLYGPGTGTDAPAGACPVHVDAAAHAALLAIRRDAQGVFNICEPNQTVSARRAEAELGWSAGFRMTATDFSRDAE